MFPESGFLGFLPACNSKEEEAADETSRLRVRTPRGKQVFTISPEGSPPNGNKTRCHFGDEPVEEQIPSGPFVVMLAPMFRASSGTFVPLSVQVLRTWTSLE